MHSDEFRYRSKDGLNLYARMWTPEGDVRGVVVLVHGLGEYGGRYVDIAQRFVNRGYAFVAGDLRGHGVSQGSPASVARLDDFMDELVQYCDEVRARAAEIQGAALVMHGEGGVVAMPEGSKRLAAGVSGDVTLKRWPGLYHFIHHEPDGAKERVLAFAADWLDMHAKG